MKNIDKLLKLYLNQKLKNQSLIFIFNALIVCMAYITILIVIEDTAYLVPYIKIKILNASLIIVIAIFLFIILKNIIHKYSFRENSTNYKLAQELIYKLPTKDRIINVLQIYSKIDQKSPYIDLTKQAINDLEKEINFSDIKRIQFTSPSKSLYRLLIIIGVLITLISFSKSHYNAAFRLIQYNTLYERPLPFELSIKGKKQKMIFKNEKLTIKINGDGKLPNVIDLYWLIDGKIYTKKINKIDNIYENNFNQINEKMKIWGQYSNNAILPYNNYIITSDTLNVLLKERPEIKELNILIMPPKYTEIEKIEHNPSLTKIEVLEGSKINFKGIVNKNLKKAEIFFDDNQNIEMNINKNIITTEFEIIKNYALEIICLDNENNYSIPTKYSIIKKDDFVPYITINKPKDNFKIEQDYSMPISIEVVDDFGIKDVYLNYYLNRPYYLEQDTTLNKFLIFKSKKNKTTEYINYNWDLSNLNLGPGDKILYWIEAYDNNFKTGPGIGRTETLTAYFPDLEELYFEIEQEQEQVIDTFEDMNESIDELKGIYEELSQDILKNDTSWEQEQEAIQMAQELQEISEKIESLEETIKTIEELNQKNDLINSELGEKIQQLQQLIKESLSPELMDALQKLQENITQDDFEKSIQELNNLEFEMKDLEKKLDRMLELFEKIMIEQKLEEITKKIEEMNDTQKNITDTINQNPLDSNIKPMINTQNNNLENIEKTMEEAESLINKTDEETASEINDIRTGNAPKEIKKEMEEILNNESNNQESMNKSSNDIENNINEMMQEMESIISSYKKKENLEMLIKYIRIIKNLIDMSYEQELIISESKNIKSKKDKNIPIIASKQNILIQQYKNTFIQISDLAKQSFHIKPETSKTFSQIFNNLSKTIAGFEQGKITTAKKHQILSMEYINKTILLLIDAMEAMQSSGTASGYNEYMEAMQELSQGQQALNQSMISFLPMPGGKGENGQGMMESLMAEQKKLMDQLKKMMNQNSGSEGEEQGGLGKALEDMDEIIKDFEQNNVSQESIDRGKRVYEKLLEHQKSMETKGTDDKWETEQGNKEKALINNYELKLNDNYDPELKELYKTLDGLEKNNKMSKDNKIIIEEYIRMLIKNKLEQENE